MSQIKYFAELPKLHWVYEDGSECDYYDKGTVRKSKEWYELKDFVEERQNWKDPLTLSPLRSGRTLHHCLLDEEKYGVLDSDNFVVLNKLSHKFLHFAYEYYKKDPEFLDRLKQLLDKMVELNEGETKVHFAHS